jgi:hypothetical protein
VLADRSEANANSAADVMHGSRRGHHPQADGTLVALRVPTLAVQVRLCLFGQLYRGLLRPGVDALPQAGFPGGVSGRNSSVEPVYRPRFSTSTTA